METSNVVQNEVTDEVVDGEAVENAVEGEATEAEATQAETTERRDAVTTETFAEFIGGLTDNQYDIPEAAAAIGMAVGSFRTRLSVFRTAMKAAGLTIPTFRDGRHGRKGVKREGPTALQKAIAKMVAKNKQS